jgi:hypothetical protein
MAFLPVVRDQTETGPGRNARICWDNYLNTLVASRKEPFPTSLPTQRDWLLPIFHLFIVPFSLHLFLPVAVANGLTPKQTNTNARSTGASD